MIPLNRPGHINSRTIVNGDIIGSMSASWFATAGDALNFIYHTLYKERGPLKVGVSPLACFHAHYPIVLNGHTPVFIDVDKQTLNLDTKNIHLWPVVDVLEVIHLAGNPCDMTTIRQWAQQNNTLIVEDCAQALGSIWNGKYLGLYGDYSVVSLIKNIYVSGSLMLSKQMIDTSDCKKISNCAMIYKKLRWGMESMCGISKYNLYNYILPTLLKLREKKGSVTSTMRVISNNQVHIILSFLGEITELNDIRRKNFEYIQKQIDSEICSFQECFLQGVSNRNRILCISKKENSNYIINILRKKGIAANNLTQNYLHSFQSHIREDKYLKLFYDEQSLTNYNNIFRNVFAIPNSPFLTQKEIDYIIKTVNSL